MTPFLAPMVLSFASLVFLDPSLATSRIEQAAVTASIGCPWMVSEQCNQADVWQAAVGDEEQTEWQESVSPFVAVVDSRDVVETSPFVTVAVDDQTVRYLAASPFRSVTVECQEDGNPFRLVSAATVPGLEMAGADVVGMLGDCCQYVGQAVHQAARDLQAISAEQVGDHADALISAVARWKGIIVSELPRMLARQNKVVSVRRSWVPAIPAGEFGPCEELFDYPKVYDVARRPAPAIPVGEFGACEEPIDYYPMGYDVARRPVPAIPAGEYAPCQDSTVDPAEYFLGERTEPSENESAAHSAEEPLYVASRIQSLSKAIIDAVRDTLRGARTR